MSTAWDDSPIQKVHSSVLASAPQALPKPGVVAIGASVEIQVSSRLEAPAPDVWARLVTPEGINYEMRLWLRMTTPAGVERLDLPDVVAGEPIGRSGILLFGAIPFGYDEITLVRIDEGQGYLERSRMLSQRPWEHERFQAAVL